MPSRRSDDRRGAAAPPEPTTRRGFLSQLGSGLAAVGISSRSGLLHDPATDAPPPPLAGAEALLIAFSDLHSAYERYPQILAAIDRVRAQHPRVPLLILFNGDLFERGNVVALRGSGRADLVLLRALAERAPVVFNLGNHEGALFDLQESVRLLQECGATVISNAVDLRTGQPFAPPAAYLELAGRRLAIAGLATSDLATYRAPVRETLRVPNGPDYAAQNLTRLLGEAPLRVVLSHEGTLDDRRMLPWIPDGTLLVGGHDHLLYAHRQESTLYLHPGSWGETIVVVGVRQGASGAEWVHEEVPIAREEEGGGEGDPALSALIAAEQQAHLTADDRAVIAHTGRALPLHEAALLAAAAVQGAAGADVGLIANTTFGTGLPAGAISRYQFDAFVRFDGGLQRAATDGATLQAILRRANQFDDTPFEQRTGEYVVATPPGAVDPARRYTLATIDWVRLNAERYLGTTLDFTPLPELRLKTVVARALAG